MDIGRYGEIMGETRKPHIITIGQNRVKIGWKGDSPGLTRGMSLKSKIGRFWVERREYWLKFPRIDCFYLFFTIILVI